MVLLQLTVIHPRVPTPKASAPVPTEAPVQTVDKQVPAHLLLSPQHVKSPVHTIVDHYLDTKMNDHSQTLVAPTSKTKSSMIKTCLTYIFKVYSCPDGLIYSI